MCSFSLCNLFCVLTRMGLVLKKKKKNQLSHTVQPELLCFSSCLFTLFIFGRLCHLCTVKVYKGFISSETSLFNQLWEEKNICVIPCIHLSDLTIVLMSRVSVSDLCGKGFGFKRQRSQSFDPNTLWITSVFVILKKQMAPVCYTDNTACSVLHLTPSG